MRAHCFQHVPFEGLGSIGSWLNGNDVTITFTRFFESDDMPDVDGIDLLIIMGGPMSANDEEKYPWLAAEKRFIRDAVQAGKAVVGVCLGAQLIANALGARVYRNPVKEIGWFPVRGVTAPEPSSFRFPGLVEVFHWHGETFDLPPGAVHLAESEGCRHQAFQLGRSVVGLQFHLETTPETARELVAHCRAELLPATYVQAETEIIAAEAEKYLLINGLMNEFLEYVSAPSRSAGAC